MIDYSSIIDFLQSDEYVDRTDCFSTFIYHRYETLQHCCGTGSSLFLKTMACFLDNTVDAKEVFRRLKVGCDENVMEKANTYRVLYLDFTDFDAKDYEGALAYLRNKMSETYKQFYRELADKGNSFYWRHSFKAALDIIEGIPSNEDLQRSLILLLFQLRDYESNNSNRKLAVLIDNMVQMETVAERNGYSKELDEFLSKFIVEDVYKYCGFFLQISDIEETDALKSYTDRYRVHWHFSAFSIDVWERYPELIVPKEDQAPFHYKLPEQEPIDWKERIILGRKEVAEAEIEEERQRQEQIRREKERYAIELLPSIPLFSPNMGIRDKRLDKHSPRYGVLNTLLKKLYMDASPKLDAETVYSSLLGIDYGKRVVRDEDELEAELKQLTQQNPIWEDGYVKANGGDWVQVICHRKDDEPNKTPARPESIKVYAYFGNGNSQCVFVDSIRYLLTHAQQMFAAKTAVFERADQMCYWLDPMDHPCLERFFEPYFDDMIVSMPFMAYKGKLGISKDFPGTDDSYNYTQAHIMSDYFMTVKDPSEIDLEAMYNHYIAKWNADHYEEYDLGFKGNSALSFVVILDTLDAILDGEGIDEQSSLLSPEGRMWRILAESRCWADVNEEFLENDRLFC